MSHIIIGADIVPIDPDIELFSDGNIGELIGKELVKILGDASYRIFNLEVPLTDNCQPIQKYGPSLIAPTSTIKAIKLMGADALTLANNHIMDQGVQGLESTLHVLENNRISYVGVGHNLEEAKHPFFFSINDKCYGIYACAEHEFSIAEDDKPGANPFDPLESLDHVKQMRAQCDYVIVLFHGGKEYYRYPSPNVQKICRKFIEKGANLVVCQHSHCIGCKEEYKNGTIVYGQGNFLFNKRKNECWDTGILIDVCDSETISYIPFIRQKHGIRLAKGKEADEIVSAFEKRSKQIEESGFVEKKFLEFANQNLPGYMLYFLGINDNSIYRILNKISGQRLRKYIAKHVMNNRGLGIRTYIECEAHRELLLKGLKSKINEWK